MFEAMLIGLQSLMSWKMLVIMTLSAIVGNFFGAIPGLNGALAISLAIPFVYGMDPYPGLCLLLSMHSVINTGSSIPSILFAIPGTGAAVPTILDGYPMTQQGRAGEAMGAQLAASAFGGVIGAGVLAALIPVLTPISMSLASGELFALILFGFTFVVLVSGDSIPKGFLSGLIGLGLGTVGLNPHTGTFVTRYTFGQLWLWEGVHLVVIVMGLFGFAEMIDFGVRGKGGRIAEVEMPMTIKQLWDGTKAVFENWWLTLRTAIMGSLIGIIPGLGGDASSWICYGHAAQTCKNNENFGKGDIRGVIAPESANNAKEGGALLPTLVFGIPGSAGMAILMGALLMLGIAPGYKMVTENLDMIWFLVFVIIFSNIIGAAILYPVSSYMGKLSYVRGSLLIPIILIFTSTGAFMIKGHWEDLVLAFFFGLLGYGMKKWDFSRAPLIFTFVLGELAEKYLLRSIETKGIAAFQRPIALVLLVLSALSLAYSIWQRHRKQVKTRERAEWSIRITGESVFDVLLIFIFSVALVLSTNWPMRARLLPLVVTIGGIGMGFWALIEGMRQAPQNGKEQKSKEGKRKKASASFRSEIIMILWVLSLICTILLLGFWVAILLFMFIFITAFGKESWKTATIFSVGVWVFIFGVFHLILQIPLYEGILGLGFF